MCLYSQCVTKKRKFTIIRKFNLDLKWIMVNCYYDYDVNRRLKIVKNKELDLRLVRMQMYDDSAAQNAQFKNDRWRCSCYILRLYYFNI